MATKFQSRIVGTIILAAVGVIFLPDILDGEKQHFKEEFAKIPLKPDLENSVESFEVLEPINDDIELPESPVEMIVQEQPVETAEPAVPETDQVEVAIRDVPQTNEYQDSAWIIQLMSLKNEENAKTVVADLQKRGYPSQIIQENGFNRVIVGPDVSKEKLERQLQELNKITGSTGRLLKFKPLNP